jgi:beta-glucosidase/6-phospho-beta-glucosidase/beta-galactosidase
MFTFVFATGIENSAPKIKGGRERVDELEKCHFYERWRTDFDLVEDLGLHFLRYGPPIHKTWLGDGRYDWAFADETFAALKAKDILPIVDLCHFGVPDWVGDFQTRTFHFYSNATPETSQSASGGYSSTPRSTRCSSAPRSRLAGDGGTSN